MVGPPSAYEVMAGSSSHDIRQAAILTVAGPEPPPRQLTGRDVAAADFDDYANITLVDATRESGDAVATPEPGGSTLFRAASWTGLPAATSPCGWRGPGPAARESRGGAAGVARSRGMA